MSGHTWLFCCAWGGVHPLPRPGGVWAPYQRGPALLQPPPCPPCRPSTRCTCALGPAPQWPQSTAQTDNWVSTSMASVNWTDRHMSPAPHWPQSTGQTDIWVQRLNGLSPLHRQVSAVVPHAQVHCSRLEHGSLPMLRSWWARTHIMTAALPWLQTAVTGHMQSLTWCLSDPHAQWGVCSTA